MTFPLPPNLPPAGPLFDAYGFAGKLAPAVRAAGGVRAVARLTELSPATISRACRGWSDLSHEAVLRLEAWLASMERVTA